MAIRPRGNSFFVDVTVKGKRRTTTRATHEEAEIAEAELRASLLRGDEAFVRPNRSTQAHKVYTLQAAYNGVEREPPPLGWRGTRGVRTSLINAREALAYFGKDKPLQDIDKFAIKDYRKQLENKGIVDSTINRKMSALSKMLTLAVEEEWIEDRPRIKRLDEGKGRLRWVSDEEERSLLDLLTFWNKHDHVDVITVLLDTGMRCGELLAFEGRDVDLKQNLIMLQASITKTNEARSVPMTKRVRKIVESRMVLQGEGRVFPYKQSWLRHGWDRARSHLGLAQDKEFTPHLCRHTCASRLVQRGVSLKVVMDWLGHKAPKTTMRYAKLAPIHLIQASAVLEPDGDEV